MRFNAFILAAAMSRTVTGSSAVSEREKYGLYVSHIAQIHTMCPSLKGENISKVLSGYFSELTNQVALVPDLGGEQWENEVCFYLGHNQDDRSTRRKIRSLLLSLMNRLIDISAKEKLYSDYLIFLHAKVERHRSELLEMARQTYDTRCQGTRHYWFISKFQVEKFRTLPRQVQSAIYYASFGLEHALSTTNNVHSPLSKTEKYDACLQMRNMMVSASNAVDQEIFTPENFVGYYLMAIQSAVEVLKAVHRPMPPLLN